MFKILMTTVIGMGLIGCADQSMDKYKERAEYAQEGANKAENKNIDERAHKMELDLQKRFRFYNGVSNNYVGLFKINGNDYQMRVEMFPSIHIIESDRIRTLEEIQDDMNNLHLNAQVVIWDKAGSIGAKGCVFTAVKPDIMNGVIQLSSTDCPNRYTIYVGNNKSSQSQATALREGKQKTAQALQTTVSSQHNPNGYSVSLRKK